MAGYSATPTEYGQDPMEYYRILAEQYGIDPSQLDPSLVGQMPNRDTSFGGPPAYSPDYTTKDPMKMAVQNRTVAADRGNRIDASLLAEQQYRAGLEQAYRNPMNAAYSDLAQTPGYTPEEQAQIVRAQQLYGIKATPEELAAMAPTDAETAAMQGDPEGYAKYFKPEKLNGTVDAMESQLRGTEGYAGNRLDSQTEALQKSLGASNDAYRDAGIQNEQLGEKAVHAAIDPARLRMSSTYETNERMTPADLEAIKTSASNKIRDRYGAAIGDLERNAAAAGSATPLAIGAARARLEDSMAAGAADAALDADIAGRAQQAQREQQIENTRLDAERGYSNLATTNEQQLMAQRLGLAKDITQRQIDAAKDLENEQQENTKYMANLGTGNTETIGSARTGVQQYNTNTGTAITQAADKAAADRAAQLYGIRQGNAQYAQGTRFNQGNTVENEVSQQNKDVANARIAGGQEVRGWLTGQTGQQVEAGQTATGQRIQNTQVQTGAQNNAASTAAQYDIGKKNAPSWFTKNIVEPVKGLSQAAGNFAKVGG